MSVLNVDVKGCQFFRIKHFTNYLADKVWLLGHVHNIEEKYNDFNGLHTHFLKEIVSGLILIFY